MRMTEQEFQSRYRILILEPTMNVETFHCGDEDLDDFIVHEANFYGVARIAVTYIVMDCQENNKVVAYFSLANDKLSVSDFLSNSEFNRFRKHRFVHEKRLRSYPAVKLFRLGVSNALRGTGIGSILLSFMIRLYSRSSRAGCRFITVDAYQSAVPFYAKNDFLPLSNRDTSSYTRMMYFDLGTMADDGEDAITSRKI